MTDLIQMLVLCSIALSCSVIGPFLVLKRMTMFANSLSHTILLGIGVSFLLMKGSELDLIHLLIGAFVAAFLSAFCTSALVKFFKLQEDASIGLVFTAFFALGITIITLYTKNVHLGIESVMGNVDILQFSDFKYSMAVAFFNVASVLLLYRPLKLMSFDLGFAKTLKIRVSWLHFLLLFLTSATCITAFRAVGVLLVLAFLTGPFLTARMFFHKLKSILFMSIAIACLSSILGVILSRILFDTFGLALSTGGIVTTLIGLNFVGAKCLKIVKSSHAKKGLSSR